MEGLLRHRRQVLSGILNGVDYRYWDPRHDPYIARHYWIDNLEDKLHNKHQLQQVLGLAVSDQIPLLAHISRLTWQKGIDFILEGLHELMHIDAVQLVVLGSGEAHYEQALRVAAQSFPDRLSVKLAYDESLAHRIQAGADMLLMPSRYEPCGLTQMYSMRYGTIPVVHRCGGLADTIVDTSPATLQSQTATGFCFDHTTTGEFLRSTRESIAAYRSGLHWRQIMHTAMHKDYSWSLSAQKYVAAYYEIIEEKQGVSDQGRSGDRV
jgi:starch synthase